MSVATASARWLAIACVSLSVFSGCQLAARVRDCNSDDDCAAGTVCNDTRHFCQHDTPELCDGRELDDDHDGISDARETFGACRLLASGSMTCRDGERRCSANGAVCEAIARAATDTCSNGIDDDCNGVTDDGADCMASYPVITPTAPLAIGSNDPNFGEGDDTPQHDVCLDAFRLDRYEVTVAAFARFLNTLPAERVSIDTPGPINPVSPREHYAMVSDGAVALPYIRLAPEASQHLTVRFSLAHGWAPTRAEDSDLPALNVTWYGADAYCRWAGKHLPTEAEWWRAARGPDGRASYPWGSTAPDCARANIGADGGCGGQPLAVDSLRPSGNPEGVLHLYGNAQEWMFDWLNETADRMRNNYYQDSPVNGWCAAYPAGPLGPDAGSPVASTGDAGLECLRCRFARGRSYASTDARPGVRSRFDADRGNDTTGFRCATGGAMR